MGLLLKEALCLLGAGSVKFFSMRFFVLMSCVLLSLSLSACKQEAEKEPPADMPPPEMKLQKTTFDLLPGWGGDDYTHLVQPLVRSCGRILKRKPDDKFGPLEQAGTYGDWQGACEAFAGVAAGTSDQIKTYLETYFTPYLVSEGDNAQGLFTGYYEASLRGSRQQSEIYAHPLYKRPADLVMVDLGQFRDHLKGERIAGRVINGNLVPYEGRTQIVAGDWPHNDQVLVWVDDAVDAFFLQIQGSGRIVLDDGGEMRAGYAGQNGHPYYAIGRELIKMGELTPETVSMQTIESWLKAHPDQADAIMNTNQSYVFFQELEGEGPLGGENLALTPLRSLAIDRSKLPYGLPLWVDIDPPMQGRPRLQQMMVAQDTGGAIRGAVRGDVFWGYGEEAELLAGHMKSAGRYWALLPKTRDDGGAVAPKPATDDAVTTLPQ